jgi:hypothetical protein
MQAAIGHARLQRMEQPASPKEELPTALRVVLALFGAAVLLWGLFSATNGCYGCGLTDESLLDAVKGDYSLRVIFNGFKLQLLAVVCGFVMNVEAFSSGR